MLDTHMMSAKEAVEKIRDLPDGEVKATLDHELAHPRKPRKTVVAALRERLQGGASDEIGRGTPVRYRVRAARESKDGAKIGEDVFARGEILSVREGPGGVDTAEIVVFWDGIDNEVVTASRGDAVGEWEVADDAN